MAKLVWKAGRRLTRRRFSDTPGLIREVYASLVECLENRGEFRTRPFDDRLCDRATLADVDDGAVADFVETAEAAGRLTLKGSRTSEAVLRNFNLVRDNRPANVAIRLFGKNPRGFFHNTQVHCSILMERKSGNPLPHSSLMKDAYPRSLMRRWRSFRAKSIAASASVKPAPRSPSPFRFPGRLS